MKLSESDVILLGRVNELLRDGGGSHTIGYCGEDDDLELVPIVRGSGGVVMPAEMIWETFGLAPREEAMQDSVPAEHL